MAKNAFIVIDLETGGTDEAENPIMQIAFQCLDYKGKLIEEYTYNEIIKPYGGLKIEKDAIKVHGITEKRANKEGVSIQVALTNFIEVCKKLNPSFGKKGAKFRKPTIVAHNAEFEMDFLMENVDNILGKYLFEYVEGVPMDTLKLGRMAYPNSPTHKLGVLAKLMGVELTDAHDAMSDVKATRIIFVELMNRLKNMSGQESSEAQAFEYKF